MRKILFLTAILLSSVVGLRAEGTQPPLIEVTGSATLNIIPDRITVEIGMEEYFRFKVFGDSVLVGMPEIEKGVRKVLRDAGVPDSMIVISDLGNYRNRNISSTFLMAKSLSATVFDFNQLERISEKLDRRGISSFSISKSDNSDMESYNRKGLKAALGAARQKAEFIAENENLELLAPYEIEETTNGPAGFSAVSNVQFDQGAGMDSMRRIVRRYSVKVRYLFKSE